MQQQADVGSRPLLVLLRPFSQSFVLYTLTPVLTELRTGAIKTTIGLLSKALTVTAG